jgi:Na+/H+-dicarboxylate symporter
MEQKPLYRSLYLQVIAAIVIGVLLSHFHTQADAAEPEAEPDPIAQHLPATPAR